MEERKNIVYLYSEVMPYAIAVMRALVHGHGMQVDCIHWDRDKRTPFVPEDEQGITFHKRSIFDKDAIIKFVEEKKPAILYVVGRMDELYLEAALHFRSSTKVVTGSDNQWRGDVKQYIMALLSPVLYRRYFEYFWVPGKRQYLFARKMGYSDNKIIRNLLTGDSAVFGGAYSEYRKLKQEKYPHTMVFAGRFAREKGLDILTSAFREAKRELNNDWRLVLVGAGDMVIEDSADVDVRKFMTGEAITKESRNWGAFCLPSTYEPWGVVVHEFAMLGLPILCSNTVGAADELVVNEESGFIFKSGDKDDLKNAIIRIMTMSDDALLMMGERSHELSGKYSPSIAARSLVSILA